MNLQYITASQLTLWVVMGLGLLVAVFIGNAVGSSDIRSVALVVGIIPVAVVFVKLKTNIWVLLPIGWYLTGRLPWLPLPFTVGDLCFITVILFFTLFFATRAVPWKRKLSTLDYLIYINLAYLATVYVRNPVGFWAMQSSMVGGRPYFEVALAFGAFAILSRVQINDFTARIFPLFFVVPAWGLATLDLIARLLPQTAYPLAMMYSGVGPRSVTGFLEEEAQLGETRMVGMQNAGLSSVLALCAKYNPVTLISPLYPLRACLLAIAFGAIFLSGFRSVLLFGMLSFVLSTLLRGRLKDLWIAGSAMLVAVVALIFLQGSLLQLPLTMQRAMSWLPGDWNQEAVADAERSSRWRFEMVEWAWNDNTILRNKMWGQGIGMSINDMNLIAGSLMAGEGGGSRLGGSDRENFMITGTFHNGPISAVKCVGVVGLFLYSLLIFYQAVQAWRLCTMARGSSAFTLALFVSIPVIYFPFAFFVLTGFYEIDLAKSIFAAGLMNLTFNYFCNTERKTATSGQMIPVEISRGHSAQALRPMSRHVTG